MSTTIHKCCVALFVSIFASVSANADEIPFWNPVTDIKEMSCLDGKWSFRLSEVIFGSPVLAWNSNNTGWKAFKWIPFSKSELVKSKCRSTPGRVTCNLVVEFDQRKLIKALQTINFDLYKIVIREEGEPEKTFDCY